MSKKFLALLSSLLVIGFVFSTVSRSFAVPPRPDLLEKWQKEGKIGAFRTRMGAVAQRAPGLNRAPTPPRAITLTGTKKALVLLVDFSDNKASTTTYPTSHYEDLLFSKGTYSTGSMRDFYLENSYNKFDLTGTVSKWYRAPQTYAYYVDNQNGFGYYPKNAQRLVEDVVKAADTDIDFSQYDWDGDGYVDALIIVHAGFGAEEDGSTNKIWSHQWDAYAAISVDNVKVNTYSMQPDNGRVGVFSHETGHVLGLPDFYDYGYDSAGLGMWSLMAAGSWNGERDATTGKVKSDKAGTKPSQLDAWSKIKLGWISPTVLRTNLNNASFPKVETSSTVYKLWTSGKIEQEYFLVENRQKTGFDEYLPGSGLLIYHIDETKKNNNDQYHYLVGLEEADGKYDLRSNSNSGDGGDPWPGTSSKTEFSDTSTPNSKSYSDTKTNVAVNNISASAATMTADLNVEPPKKYLISGYVKTGTGTGIPSVTVSLSGSGSGSYTTGTNGYYEFSVGTGTFKVTPTKTGWGFTPTEKNYTDITSDQSNQNFTGSATNTYYIDGYVKSGEEAVAGVTLTLSGDVYITTTTNASGYYKFANLAQGNYNLTPSFSGWVFTPAKYSYSDLFSNKTAQDFTAAENKGNIAGTVRSSTGAYVSGASVDVWGWSAGGYAWGSTVTANNGHYTLSNLPAATSAYYVQVDPYDDSDLIGDAKEDVTVIAGQTTTLDFTLSIGGKITGKVTDANGKPVQYAYLYAWKSGSWSPPQPSKDLTHPLKGPENPEKQYGAYFGYWGWAVTDSSGNYTMRGLNTADFDITVYPPTYYYDEYGYYHYYETDLMSVTERKISVTAGKTTTKDFTLYDGGRIAGKVLDKDGNPVKYAYLYAWSETSYWSLPKPDLEKRLTLQHPLPAPEKSYGYWSYATTDSSGNYVMKGLNTSSFTVTCYPPYDSDLVREEIRGVYVVVGTTKTLNITLNQGGRIVGTVTDYENKKISYTYVSAWSQDWLSYDSAQTDTNGRYVIKGLHTSSYTISVSPPSYRTDLMSKEIKDVYVVAGTTKPLNVQLQKGGEIAGQVKDSQGNAVSGAYLYAWSYSSGWSPPKPGPEKKNLQHPFPAPEKQYGYWGYATTDSNGNYKIGGLETGTFEVYVSPPDESDLVSAYEKDVSVTVGSTTVVNFTLSVGGKITGRVSDKQGNAVPGTYLYTYSSDWSSWGSDYIDYPSYYSTNQDSYTYTIKGLPSGSYTLNAYAPWDRQELIDQEVKDITVTAGQTVTQNIVFEQGGKISGKVTDKSGNPISNADIYVSYSGLWTPPKPEEKLTHPLKAPEKAQGYWGYDTTDSSGNYTIDGLTSGSFYVWAYPPYNSDYIWDSEPNVSVTAGQTTTLNIILKIGGRIAGRVTDIDGKPVANASVDAWQTYEWEYDYTKAKPTTGEPQKQYGYYAYGTTDANGYYTLKGLETANYTVGVDPYYTSELASERKTNVSVTIEQTTVLDFTLQVGGKISGKVTDEENNVSSNTYIAVYTQSDWHSTYTDSQGKYLVKGLSKSTYTVSAQPRSGSELAGETKKGVFVDYGQIVTVNFTLKEGGKLTGRITDETGKGVASASVDVWKASGYYGQPGKLTGQKENTTPAGPQKSSYGYTSTDEQGYYTVYGLETGSYTVSVSPESYWDERLGKSVESDLARESVDNVPITLGKTTTLDITLEKAGKIAGKITDENNKPVSDVSIYAYTEDYKYWGYDWIEGTASTYEMTQLHQGTYTVTVVAEKEGSEFVPEIVKSVVVTSEKTTELNITMKKGGKISGKITDAYGNAVADVSISAWTEDVYYGYGYADTNYNGYYTIKGLPSGSYNVEAYPPTKSDLAGQRVRGVIVETGQTTTLDFVLPEAGIITGQVEMSNLPTGWNYGYSVIAFPANTIFGTDMFEDMEDIDVVGETTVKSDGSFRMKIAPQSVDLYLALFYSSGDEYYSPPAGVALAEDSVDTTNLSPRKIFIQKLRKSIIPINKPAALRNAPVTSASTEEYQSYITSLKHQLNLEVLEGKTTDIGTIKPEIGPGSLSGTVSTIDGKPLFPEIAGTASEEGVAMPFVLMMTPEGQFKGLSMVYAADPKASTGTYKIGNISAGKYTALAYAENYAPATDTVEIATKAVTKNFALGGGATVTGKVTDNKDKPLTGATVKISGGGIDKLTTTDATGKYSFTGLSSGKYTLTVTAKGYEVVSKEINVETGKTYTIDFKLSAAGTISGRVSIPGTAKGKVLQEGTVDAWSTVVDTGTVYHTTVDASGKYVLSGLLFDTYKVIASVPGYVEEEKEISVSASTPSIVANFDLKTKEIKLIFGVYQYTLPSGDKGVIITVKSDTELAGGIKYKVRRADNTLFDEGSKGMPGKSFEIAVSNKYTKDNVESTIPGTESVTLSTEGLDEEGKTAVRGSFVFNFETPTGAEVTISVSKGGKVKIADVGEKGVTDKSSVNIYPNALEGKTLTVSANASPALQGEIKARTGKVVIIRGPLSTLISHLQKQAASKVYEVGLKDAVLKSNGKMDITLQYTALPAGAKASDLKVYYEKTSGEWQAIDAPLSVDELNKTVGFTISGTSGLLGAPAHKSSVASTSQSSPAPNFAPVTMDQRGKFVLLTPGVPYTGTELQVYTYPNPFNPTKETTKFHVNIPGSGSVDVTIYIYTLTGELVKEVSLAQQTAGQEHSNLYEWEGKNKDNEIVASGIYIALVKAGDKTKTFKIAVTK